MKTITESKKQGILNKLTEINRQIKYDTSRSSRVLIDSLLPRNNKESKKLFILDNNKSKEKRLETFAVVPTQEETETTTIVDTSETQIEKTISKVSYFANTILSLCPTLTEEQSFLIAKDMLNSTNSERSLKGIVEKIDWDNIKLFSIDNIKKKGTVVAQENKTNEQQAQKTETNIVPEEDAPIILKENTLEEKVESIVLDLNEETSHSINSEDIITKSLEMEEPIVSNATTVEEKIKEIKKLIEANAFKQKKQKFNIEGKTIIVSVHHENAFFARKDRKKHILDRPHSYQHPATIYVIIIKDKNKQVLSEEWIIYDEDKNTLHKFVSCSENGTYDVSGLKDNEIGCFKISNFYNSINLVPQNTTTVVVPEPKKPLVKYVDYDQINKNAEEAIELGRKLLDNNNLEQAKIHFEKALSSNQKTILMRANYYLGKIYIEKEEYITAEAYLRKSLKINPENYKTLLDLGKALAGQRRFMDAIKYFNECNKYCDLSYTHLYEKSKILYEQQDFKSALKLTEQIIKKAGNYYQARLLKVRLLYHLNKFEEAKKELEICESLAPGYIIHKVILGKIYFLEKQTDKALELFQESVQLCKQNPNLHNERIIQSIGFFFHKLNEKDLAYKYYSELPNFRKTMIISDEAVEMHIKKHENSIKTKERHSVFNFPVSLDLLNHLIKDMEKTVTYKMYDGYIIHCENAGYLEEEGNKKAAQDYIIVFTLPFTKKIRLCYLGHAIGEKGIPSITLDEITEYLNKHKQLDTVISANDNDETLILEDIENKIDYSTNDEDLESDENVIIENKQEPTTEKIVPKEVKEEVKPIIEEEQTKGTTKLNVLLNSNFDLYKDQLKTMINLLNDPTQQVVLLLSLGYVRDQYYTEEEIGEFLHMESSNIHNIITQGLSKLSTLAAISIQGVEMARNQLELNKHKQ